MGKRDYFLDMKVMALKGPFDFMARGKRGLEILGLGLLVMEGMLTMPAFAVVVTTFDGSELDSNVFLDVPDSSVAQIVQENGELRFSASLGVDMWNKRASAPFAYTSKPIVNAGQQWYAETQVRFNTFGGVDRIAGITFYGGPDGAGGYDDGMEFTFGLDQWDGPNGIWVQGLGDNQPGNSDTGNLSAAYGGNSAYLRVEVTDNVSNIEPDSYSFFYKAALEDSWSLLGSFEAAFDNSRVALFLKSNTYSVDQDASFTYFEVAQLVPEPSALSLLAVGLGGLGIIRRLRS